MRKFCSNSKNIALLYISSIILATYLFSTLEGRPYFDGLWWAVVTSLTIGYGDVFPITMAGKVMGMVFALFWVFIIIPVVIANVLNSIIENREAYTHEEQEWLQMSIQAISRKLDVKLPEPPADY